MKVKIMVCIKKSCSGQMGHFGPKNGTSDNSGSVLRTFLRFCRMKGANRYMKILLIHLFSL